MTEQTEDDAWTWWNKMLAEREQEGAHDADSGEYDPPYPNSDDPQDHDENAAYWRGFNRRRKELGPAFNWS